MAAYRRVYEIMTHVTCRQTAKNRDQPRNPTLGNRVWAIFFISDLWVLEQKKSIDVKILGEKVRVSYWNTRIAFFVSATVCR